MPASEADSKQIITTRLNKLFVKDLEKSLACKGCVSAGRSRRFRHTPLTSWAPSLGPPALMMASDTPFPVFGLVHEYLGF